ncbi:hypothetical protein SAMN05421748_103507 [Paractinoplanes atraurantiacus]|uniref:Uncharacterized protein n=2 Tax=Paractinoplanes atraurantiacus TaxID=1036182 RepID=A0A285H5W3_9ACTN|nr:hypothetical protein SAMN05421748_103507 [Actinoplanes atraurantiacus]
MVIATVFLTIIGMTTGFVLGEKQRRDEAREQEQQQQQQNQQPQESVSPPAPAIAAEDLCPSETLAKARSLGFSDQLRRLHRYVTDRGTVVWICQDPGGRLFYQSKTGGEQKQLVQGVNGLLLTDAVETGENAYEATAANGNQFFISRKQLKIEFVDGRKDQVDDVVDFE